MKTDIIEKNGPANIVSLIRAYKLQYKDDISVETRWILKRIEEQCWSTMAYMDKLSNPDDVRWIDFKPKEKQNVAS